MRAMPTSVGSRVRATLAWTGRVSARLGLVPATLAVAGCGAVDLQNDPPRLRSVNGVEISRFGYYDGDDPRWRFTQGEDYPIELEITDPEGNGVRVWWPWSPGGFEFDPDQTAGVWHVPEDHIPWADLVLVLEDTHRTDPRASTWYLYLWSDQGWDTGWYDE